MLFRIYNSLLVIAALIIFCSTNLQAQREVSMEKIDDSRKKILDVIAKSGKSINFSKRYFRTKYDSGKVGLVDYKGRTVIPIENRLIAGSFFWLLGVYPDKSSNMSIYNILGQKLTEQVYTSIKPCINTDCMAEGERILVKKQNCNTESNKSGFPIGGSRSTYTREDVDKFSLGLYCMYYLVTDTFSRNGVIDAHLNQLIPFEYKNLSYAGGSYFHINNYDSLDTLIDVESNKVVAVADEITPRSSPYTEENVYLLKNGENVTLLNSSLETIIDKGYTFCWPEKDYIICKDQNKNGTVYNMNGEILIENEPAEIIMVNYEEPYFIYNVIHREKETPLQEIKDRSGNVIYSFTDGNLIVDQGWFRNYTSRIPNKDENKKIIGYIHSKNKGVIIYEDYSIYVYEGEI